MSLKDIQQRYRVGESLSAGDKVYLENLIALEDDMFSLQSAIYLYGVNFKENDLVIKRADYFITSDPMPGLTATCLKVLADFWNMSSTYQNELEKYLDYHCYEDWYDEVAVSVSFFLRYPHFQTASVKLKLAELEKQARVQRENSLIELFTSIRDTH
jgi:hypothetical protein